jgi:glycosyltransferase involved in cell wall biosynthesis
MDGGSRDDFKAVLDRYWDLISAVDYGPDRGQADAIRKGLQMCDGDIVSWLNADDYYFPHCLERVSEIFSTHPKVDVVYGDAVHVEPTGLFLAPFHGIEQFNPERLFRSCYICQPACFVRRRAYEEVGGVDGSLGYTMDWDLWCRLAIKKKIFFQVNEPMAAVRYYPGTKTLSGSKTRYLEIWRIQRQYGGFRMPSAWPGFYWFDLYSKKEKRIWEKAIFLLLQAARLIRKRYKGGRSQSHYGFVKWERNVKGTARVLFPWYGDEGERNILFELRPRTGSFLLGMREEGYEKREAVNGRIVLPIRLKRGYVIDFRISCVSSLSWELLGLSWAE